jgi:hypothetical protein
MTVTCRPTCRRLAVVFALVCSMQEVEHPPSVDLSPPTSEEGEPPKDPCLDVYDRSEGCEGLMNVPVEGMAEPLSEPEDKLEDETFLFSWFDNDLLNWGLLGMASVAMVGAVAFHAASFFYAAQLADQARLGQIGPSALSTTSGVQTALGIGAGAMWVSAAMFGGTALALWAFDPETGAIRLPFFDE